MESWNSGDRENESPSQENIAHLQTIKRDGESLEDFEDITKDESSMKDLTAQFLQFETENSDRHKGEKKEYVFQDDNLLDYEPKSTDYFSMKSNDERVSQEPTDLENLVLSEPDSLKVSDREDSFNNLYSLEQTNMQSKPENMERAQENPISNILDENKLIDFDASNDDISTGSDFPSFIPKKNEESKTLNSESERDIFQVPPHENKPYDATEAFIHAQSMSNVTPKSGMGREQEVEVLQGDGLHVKKTIEGDMSEDDDFIPEPIPKDYPEIGAIEGKQFLAAIGIDAWFHPELLHPKVESLIYWRDPKKSGIVFGGILIVLLSLTSFSLISVLAYTSLIALFSALAFRIYKSVMQAVQKTSEGHPFKKYLVAVLNHSIITAVFNTIEEYLDIDLTVSPEKAREISDVVVSYINRGLTECRRLFLIEDVIDSVKFGVLLWCFTYIGAWFNGLSLIIIAFVGLFTLPKVYENNKTQIDANMDVVKAKISEVTEKITAVIPLGKKTEDVKDKAE